MNWARFMRMPRRPLMRAPELFELAVLYAVGEVSVRVLCWGKDQWAIYKAKKEASDLAVGHA